MVASRPFRLVACQAHRQGARVAAYLLNGFRLGLDLFAHAVYFDQHHALSLDGIAGR